MILKPLDMKFNTGDISYGLSTGGGFMLRTFETLILGKLIPHKQSDFIRKFFAPHRLLELMVVVCGGLFHVSCDPHMACSFFHASWTRTKSGGGAEKVWKKG